MELGPAFSFNLTIVFFGFEGYTWTYGSSQARGRIRAAAAVLCHSNTGSLTQWPGIELASSWTLCWVLNLLSRNGNSCTLF